MKNAGVNEMLGTVGSVTGLDVLRAEGRRQTMASPKTLRKRERILRSAIERVKNKCKSA